MSTQLGGEPYTYNTSHGLETELAKDTLLIANLSSSSELNCATDLVLEYPGYGEFGVQGVLNITTCDKDANDIRLVSTLVLPVNTTGPEDSEESYNITTLGLLCSPSFTIHDALIQVKWLSGEVLRYTGTPSTPDPVDVQISTDAIYAYLNNPMDDRSQDAFLLAGDTGEQPPEVNRTKTAVRYYSLVGSDPFTASLLSDHANLDTEIYLTNPQLFQTSVERLASRILAQVAKVYNKRRSRLNRINSFGLS
ncbi:uncharacterized protein K452DRAFT_313959 [Aplosporella prunicola CBS 121167]|uniref:Uncharacterized protein n=1 Tax=Aplosporella prunicola CBS 121167 TaxID=1176127 RepID=A0A6A6AX26_9PEZI|nr:uncharacterized protein K452DRAFT_313959 [Aplosporella prunicola CBS 121167]KAF2135484.1 hypothetical protein K452DRAFT_313959 [Aplosporella prunicola CBS 121167]